MITDTAEVPAESPSRARRMYRNQLEIDFSVWWRRGAAVSLVMVTIFGAALIFRGLNLGIEFEGGAVWEVPADDVSAGDVRDGLAGLGLADASIQTGGGIVQVRAEVEVTDTEAAAAVAVALADVVGADPEDVSFSDVSASWGEEVTEKAVRALIVFLIVIAAYISMRLEWRMAVGGLVALAHDILVTVGVYALFQFEVTSATVIAFMTILGYSLYDTMVVFDRVRENESRPSLAGRVAYQDIMSLSLNQVFMRSLNTTVTSVLPVLMVLLVGSFGFGAVTLREFGIALLVGLLAGTYSSMFVAGPIVVMLKNREPEYAALIESAGTSGQAELATLAAGGATPRRQRGGTGPSAPKRPPSTVIPPRPRKQKRRN
ncbi:MAG: protein translocase subunit SecF [Acidimicrobiia bacterium]|nr:protein translocase subunit SecF [Acidimicrobiia bacterium]